MYNHHSEIAVGAALEEGSIYYLHFLTIMSNIINSRYPNAIIVDGKTTFAEFVLGHFAEYEDKVALISSKLGKSYTFAEIIKISRRLAVGFHKKAGLRQKEVLSTCMANYIDVIPAVLGVSLLGAVVNTANPAYTVRELINQFSECKTQFVLTTADFVEKICVFGMTELSPVCLVTPLDPLSWQKDGSCGVLLPSTQCKVTDVETGEALGPNSNGEICVRGPQVMEGYLNNPSATRKTIDADGWLHTGDIGYYDEDEYFYVVDRIKDLIKVKPFQVAPAELEAILLAHQSVGDAAVVGIPDQYAGELPRAYIVLKPGAKATEDEIKKLLLAKWSAISGWKAVLFS